MRRDASRAGAGEPGARGRLGRPRPRRATGPPRRGRAPTRFLADAGEPCTSTCTSFRDGFMPYVGRRGQGRVRGAQGAPRPAGRLHPYPLRPPPGPPPRLRADVEHVPPAPDPRVRDPEGRRRPREAERVRPAHARRSSSRSSRCSRSTSRPSRASTGSTRDTFLGLMRLRGMEAVAPERFAEAFTCRKLNLSFG